MLCYLQQCTQLGMAVRSGSVRKDDWKMTRWWVELCRLGATPAGACWQLPKSFQFFFFFVRGNTSTIENRENNYTELERIPILCTSLRTNFSQACHQRIAIIHSLYSSSQFIDKWLTWLRRTVVTNMAKLRIRYMAKILGLILYIGTFFKTN